MSDSQLQLKSRSRDPVAPRAAKNAAMEQMAALEEADLKAKQRGPCFLFWEHQDS